MVLFDLGSTDPVHGSELVQVLMSKRVIEKWEKQAPGDQDKYNHLCR